MVYALIAFAILFILWIFIIIASFAVFYKIFYSSKAKPPRADEYPTPAGAAYDPYRDQIIEWIKEIRAMPHIDASVTSFDGLRLSGRFYEYKKGAPIEIMFHGYRGTAERDLCSGVHRCFEIGHSALIVDHRGSGQSEGRITTFGVNESRDCLAWIDYTLKNIDKDARIILTGISMGAATVMITSALQLPDNVIGVLADCGYTSTEAIVKKVMRDMKLPADLLYPFARLGARMFGGFDPDERSPIKAMKECKLPIIFFHGDADSYVPHSMSEENYAACASDVKRLVITPGAEHGLCFSSDTGAYLKELNDFFTPYTH